MKKRWRMGMLIVGLIALTAVMAVCFRLRIRKQAAANREAGYQATLRSYQRGISPGMGRLAVESKLRTNGAQFHGDFRSGFYFDEIKIGEEPPPWFCNYMNVYIYFEFEGKPTLPGEADSSGVLKDAGVVYRPRDCL